MLTAGAAATGSCAGTSRTRTVWLAFAVALLPFWALPPAPRTVTVTLTVWFVFAVTDGRVQVGVAEVSLSSTPPLTSQSYSTAPSYVPPVSTAPSCACVPSSPLPMALIETLGASAAGSGGAVSSTRAVRLVFAVALVLL